MLDLILDLKRKKSFKTALLRQLENIDHIKQYYYINDTSWMFCYCRYVGKYPRSYHCQPAIYFIFKKEKKKINDIKILSDPPPRVTEIKINKWDQNLKAPAQKRKP